MFIRSDPINNKPPFVQITGTSLGMRPANERRRYNVTTYLIGWAHTDPWDNSLHQMGTKSLSEPVMV